MDGSELRSRLERQHAESYGWALSCCAGDRVEAEDVLGTVYLKILEGKARYSGRAEFRTWLFAVIRKTAADAWRKEKLRRLLLQRYRESAGLPSRVESADDDRVHRSRARARFRQVLAALPRRQREVLQLVFYHDLTLSKAAEVMCVSIGSARTHYARGKERLRKWLEEPGPDHEIRVARRENQAALP